MCCGSSAPFQLYLKIKNNPFYKNYAIQGNTHCENMDLDRRRDAHEVDPAFQNLDEIFNVPPPTISFNNIGVETLPAINHDGIHFSVNDTTMTVFGSAASEFAEYTTFPKFENVWKNTDLQEKIHDIENAHAYTNEDWRRIKTWEVDKNKVETLYAVPPSEMFEFCIAHGGQIPKKIAIKDFMKMLWIKCSIPIHKI
jgi:hypothetical protein